VVSRVLPESPAKDAGIEVGEVIESIDNAAAQKITVSELRSMLCHPGRDHAVGILSENRHLQVTIRLRALI
jgi:S1-C subfamily serine protease